MEDTLLYDVFVREWWRYERGRLVPYPGAPRVYLQCGLEYQAARELCEEYNATHEPGPTSIKAEFIEAD